MSGLEEIQAECLNCGKPLKGRVDKKFCDSGCRSTYNNHRLRSERGELRAIEAILRSNRRVLSGSLSGRKTIVFTREELLKRGLRFDYFTHYWTNYRGERYSFCYDYGYKRLPGGDYLVVQWREEGRQIESKKEETA